MGERLSGNRTFSSSQSATPRIIKRKLISILFGIKGGVCLYHEEIWPTPLRPSYQPWPIRRDSLGYAVPDGAQWETQCALLPKTSNPNLIIRKPSEESRLWGPSVRRVNVRKDKGRDCSGLKETKEA